MANTEIWLWNFKITFRVMDRVNYWVFQILSGSFSNEKSLFFPVWGFLFSIKDCYQLMWLAYSNYNYFPPQTRVAIPLSSSLLFYLVRKAPGRIAIATKPPGPLGHWGSGRWHSKLIMGLENWRQSKAAGMKTKRLLAKEKRQLAELLSASANAPPLTIFTHYIL